VSRPPVLALKATRRNQPEAQENPRAWARRTPPRHQQQRAQRGRPGRAGPGIGSPIGLRLSPRQQPRVPSPLSLFVEDHSDSRSGLEGQRVGTARADRPADLWRSAQEREPTCFSAGHLSPSFLRPLKTGRFLGRRRFRGQQLDPLSVQPEIGIHLQQPGGHERTLRTARGVGLLENGSSSRIHRH